MIDRPLWILGIDPAINGGAVLISPEGDAVVGWSWRTRTKRKKRVWEVAVVQPPFSRLEPHKSIHGIAVLIRSGCARIVEDEPLAIGCEAPHVALDPMAGLSVAMTTGEMIGPLREITDLGIYLWMPAMWRLPILGLKIQTKREEAKAASLSGVPKLVPGLAEILEVTSGIFKCDPANLDHVTDAAGVALQTGRQATLGVEAGNGRKKRKRKDPAGVGKRFRKTD